MKTTSTIGEKIVGTIAVLIVVGLLAVGIRNAHNKATNYNPNLNLDTTISEQK